MSETTNLKEMKELSKQLVGKEVKLSPTAAFFREDNDYYVLNAYGDQERKLEYKTSSVIIKEDWKLGPTMRNVIVGVLRVIDPTTNEDISIKFGGPVVIPSKNNQKPAVTSSPRPMNTGDLRDTKLKQILSHANVVSVISAMVNAELMYDALERLLELELQGENPAFRSRREVVENITSVLKKTSGIGMVKKIEEEEIKMVSRK